MKKLLVLASAASAASCMAFTEGNLVVSVIDAQGATSLITRPIFLQEFDITGAKVGSPITLPSASTDKKKLTIQPDEDSEGALTLTKDGRFIMFSGYDAEPDIANSGTILPRSIAKVDGQGNYVLNSGIPVSASGGDSTRNAYSLDGYRCYITGGDAGVDLFNMDSNTPVDIVGDFSSSRYINEFNGDLYYTSSDDNLGFGNSLYKIDGVPTSGPVTPTPFIGIQRSPRTWYFLNSTTFYMGSTTGSAPGLFKYTFNGTNWVVVGSTGTLTGTITSIVYGGPVGANGHKFYAIRENGGQLLEIVDTGDSLAPWTSTVLHTFDTSEYAKGLSWAPKSFAKNITGTVDLEGIADDTNKNITVKIRNAADNSIVLDTVVVNVDGSGNFSFPTTLANGTYNFWVKSATTLSKAGNFTVGASGGNIGSLTLLNGDCDGNNVITTDDYLILSEAFDTTFGDAGYAAGADLNCDDAVTTDDYLLLSNNFDLSGDE